MSQNSDRSDLVRAVQRIMDADGSTKEIDELVRFVCKSVPDPNVANLIFWPEREMTAEEVIDTAFSYVPKALPS